MCRNGVAEREEGCGWGKARSVFSYSNCEDCCCRAGSSRLVQGEEAAGRATFTAAAATIPYLRVWVPMWHPLPLLHQHAFYSDHIRYAIKHTVLGTDDNPGFIAVYDSPLCPLRTLILIKFQLVFLSKSGRKRFAPDGVPEVLKNFCLMCVLDNIWVMFFCLMRRYKSDQRHGVGWTWTALLGEILFFINSLHSMYLPSSIYQ